jgi:DNA-binding NarL/FixJ family response regulator
VLLSDIRLASGDIDAAHQASQTVRTLANQSGSDLLLAQADLVQGKILAQAKSKEALNSFQSALRRLKPYEQSLLASRVRLEMSRLLVDEDKAGAITWARAALASFERMGATQDIVNATQLLRQLGVVARQGQPAFDTLTDREAEVLPLLAQGLTNREIAEKLVISAKTVEHHVSQILAKLGARSRAEAVALAFARSKNQSPK